MQEEGAKGSKAVGQKQSDPEEERRDKVDGSKFSSSLEVLFVCLSALGE